MNTVAEALTGRELVTRVCKYFVRRVLFPLGVLAPFAYFFPKIALFYAICGAYDVGRNPGTELFDAAALFHRQRVPDLGPISIQHSAGSAVAAVHQQGRLSAWRTCRPLIRMR